MCPRLIISDYTLRIFRGYDFRIFKILLFFDRYFGVFDSDLRASPPICLVMECPLGGNNAETKSHLFPRGHTSIFFTGMLIREQISTTQKNRMALNSNQKK